MNMEAEKLKTQAHDFKNRVPGAVVQEAWEIQVLDAGSTVHSEESLCSTQVVLNHPV